jgi:hypothetical protein
MTVVQVMMDVGQRVCPHPSTRETTVEQIDLLKMVFQLDTLQRNLSPLLPQISKKLVADLLSTGTSPVRIAKVIGRSPSYVRAVAGGGKSLSAHDIVSVIRFASQEQTGAN